MSKHIMLDIETLDTKSTAVVLSIGAVLFDPMEDTNDGDLTLYLRCDEGEQFKRGRTQSYDTVKWWMKQNDYARQVFEEQGVPPHEWSGQLNELFKRTTIDGVWGNGSDFDNVIVASLYGTFGYRAPWGYGKSRCFRTLKNMAMPKEFIKPERRGAHHNALDDAVYQVAYLRAIRKALDLVF